MSYYEHTQTKRRFEIVSTDEEAGTVTLKGEHAEFTEPNDDEHFKRMGYVKHSGDLPEGGTAPPKAPPAPDAPPAAPAAPPAPDAPPAAPAAPPAPDAPPAPPAPPPPPQ